MTYQKWATLFGRELSSFMRTAPSISGIHKTDHIRRVWKTSKALCERLHGDLEIMVATVYLHDLGRHHGLEIHGEKSAELALPILERLGFPKEKIPAVLDAITKHDYTTPAASRKSIYSKILYDADKLDAFGRVGIKRHIEFYYRKGNPIPEILDLMQKRWDGLALPESRAVGRADFEMTRNYFVNLQKRLSRTLGKTAPKRRGAKKARRSLK